MKTLSGIVCGLLLLLASVRVQAQDAKRESRKRICQSDCDTARKRRDDLAGDCSSATSACAATIQDRKDGCNSNCRERKTADLAICEGAEPDFKSLCTDGANTAFSGCAAACRSAQFNCSQAEAAWKSEACSASSAASTDATAVCNSCKDL